MNIKKAQSDIIHYVPSAPERVAVVQRMFDLCVQGYGYHYSAALLNAEGMLSPAGLPWSTARIGRIIRIPVYRGVIARNLHSMGSLFGLDGDGKLRPKCKIGWQPNDEAD